MKRIAGWLRQIADEIDPPRRNRRGRPRKPCAHRHVNDHTGWDGCSRMCVDCGAELPDVLHGWPEEPTNGRSYEIGSGEPWPWPEEPPDEIQTCECGKRRREVR